jgi:hydroxymethylpyrimidine pyrophosphatase-like HAD family hydrolase
MRYLALATDYDETIANDGVVDQSTLAALQRLRAGCRRLILVTGRDLTDLQKAMPRLDLFDLVVAENGALRYDPASRECQILVETPSPDFVARLRELGVEPLWMGEAIIATWGHNTDKVLRAIEDLKLKLQIISNKTTIMVLPVGVNKASGLRGALDQLGLSPLDCIGVGDAENDLPFLEVCGLQVAVANAVQSVKERARFVTAGMRGDGVAELIDGLLATDFAEFEHIDERTGPFTHAELEANGPG